MDSNRRLFQKLQRLALMLACAGIVTLPANAQSAAVAPDAATLAKYDKNHNGKLDPDELAAMRADEARAAKAVTTTKDAEGGGKVVELSPFEVNAAGDKGYSAMSTMAGTRLNSSLEDIASSITVVTKQQLQDTAALDINDIFQYEVGTEGTSQFTDGSNDGRSGNDAQDNVNGNPTGANRMRGLSSANIAVGGFTSASNIPIDTYNVSAVEIARGPNSNLAGLSDAGGTVNLITNGANVSRESSSLSTRADSYGGIRATIDLNRPIIKNVLSFRFSAVYNETGFVRKPSVDRTNRQQYAFTYRPFKGTTINASIEGFHEFAQRANAVTPRNTLTNWINNGKPTFDPIALTWTRNGVTSAPITNINQLPAGITGIGSSNARDIQGIDNGDIAYIIRGALPTNATIGTSANTQFTESSAEAVVGGSLFHAFGVTDKSIYDYTKINTAASNYEIQRAQTENISLEQSVLNTRRNQLNLQMAWRREDNLDYRRMFLGQTDGVPATLEVDTNARLLDGRPNPFFLHPFFGGLAPQVYTRPLLRDSYRWQAAYQLNLKEEKNVLKWLGMHRIAAYQEASTAVQAPNSLRFHDTIYDNPDFQPGLTALTATSNLSANNAALFYPVYYVGNVPGGGITYANTGAVNPGGPHTASYLNTTTGKWNTSDPVNIREVYFSQIEQKKKLRTSGLTLQSFLLNDQIVPTLGVREDRVYTEDSFSPTLSNGFFDLTNLNNFGPNKKWNHGKTRTKGVVVKPFKGFSFLDRTAQENSGIGGYLAEAIRGLNFHYNRSNSFQPADTAYSVMLTQLPNPMGKAEEYGVSLNMFSKFSMRLTHQDTVQFHTRSSLGVVATRLMSIDFQGQQSLSFDLYDAAIAWQQQLNPAISLADAQTAAAAQIGFTPAYIAQASGKTISDANDAESKGWELELQFNPNRFWTLKATGNKQEAVDSNISVYMSQYIAMRLPLWTTIKDPSGNFWWLTSQGSQGIPQSYFNTNVLSPLTVALSTQGLRKPQTREYTFNLISNYRLAGLGSLASERLAWLKNVSVGGAYRWASKSAIGYLGSAPDPVTGVISTLDKTKPFFDKPVGHLDFNASYRTKLFSNRIGTTFQLNVKDVTENGHLQGYSVNPDGRYWAYRIIDPRQFIFTATFDL
jgi:hypothetical protein